LGCQQSTAVGVDQKLLDTPRTSLDPNFLDDPVSNDADSNGNQNDNGYHEIIEEAAVGSDPCKWIRPRMKDSRPMQTTAFTSTPSK
jgi:hypothetical protein